jgi:hypothetical protein
MNYVNTFREEENIQNKMLSVSPVSDDDVFENQNEKIYSSINLESIYESTSDEEKSEENFKCREKKVKPRVPNVVKISEALRKKRERKSIQNENGKLKEFEEIDISTKTVIGISNLKINLDNFFKYMPITEYVKIEKKRGRKRRIQIPVLNNKVPSGSIICVQRKKEIRGVSLKKKENTGERNYFLHSVTVVMMLAEGKIINTKVSSNGKFQITGCKKDQQYVDTIMYLYEIMKKTQEWTGEQIFELEKNIYIEEDKKFSIIFKTVMQNMDFNIGFMISRQRLDNFINKQSKYYSIFEASISGAGVNIKVKSDGNNETQLLKLIYCENKENWNFDLIINSDSNSSNTETSSRDGRNATESGSATDFVSNIDWPIEKTSIPYSYIYNLLTEKEKLKEEKKNKYHTFLVFASGSIIMTSKGPNMKDVIYELIDVLLKNREHFEEKSQLIKIPKENRCSLRDPGHSHRNDFQLDNELDSRAKRSREVEIEFKEEY